MKKIFSEISISILIISNIIIGCKKEETDHGVPTIAFVVDSGYLYTDTVVATGDTAIIGVNCKWNGTDLIKTINVYLNNTLVRQPSEIKDSTGKELTYNLKITKSLSPLEFYEFEAIDTKGHSTRLGLTVYIDNSGGKVIKISAILGVQKTPEFGSYYNFLNNSSVLIAKAEANQELIDLVGGFDLDEKSFLSSPGSANLFGVYDFGSWTTKNLTQFCNTTITKAQYDITNKDNLLISSFHPEKAVDHITKFKKYNVYSFKTQGGKYGLMLFLAGATSEYGFITFDAKIQE